MNLHYLQYSSEKLKIEDRRLKDKYNLEIFDICKINSIPYVDICSKLTSQDISPDGVHPNIMGARVIAKEVYETLKKIPAEHQI